MTKFSPFSFTLSDSINASLSVRVKYIVCNTLVIAFVFIALAWNTVRAQNGVSLSPSSSLSTTSGNQLSLSGASPTTVDFIVAIVNSEPITNNEIKIRMIRYERRLAEQGSPMPSRADLVREILEDVIREKLQLKLARETGIRVEDRTVEAALQTFAQQNNITMNELRNRSSADGVGFAQIRSDIQNQLLIQKLREREVLSAINITDNDIDAFVKEELKSERISEQSIDLAQILIAIPDGSSESKVQSSEDRAKRILARAKAGEDFFKLAVENSDAKDASTGGQMGLKSIERYPTLFIEAVKDLNTGDVAGLIRSGAGFHVLKILTKQAPDSSNFTIVQTNVNHILLRTNPNLSVEAAKTQLSTLKRRIESGAITFASAAKEVSQDGSSAAGGELGWANPGQFVPEFEAPMAQLPIGIVSDPITSRFGVHLILVKDRRKAQLSDIEQREVAKNAIREKKFDSAYTNWIQELRGNAYVEYRDLQQ